VTEIDMPRGRRPDGENALTGAERQARYRANQQARQGMPTIRHRRSPDRRTRPQRWHDAVAELIALQAEYAAWADALPDGLRDTATAEVLQASSSSISKPSPISCRHADTVATDRHLPNALCSIRRRRNRISGRPLSRPTSAATAHRSGQGMKPLAARAQARVP
jgi:hypothetical protein